MPSLGEILKANTGRYIQKRWDWDAFPANRGFAELERAQMRYIGAGGSPKVDDRETLPPGAFTCSRKQYSLERTSSDERWRARKRAKPGACRNRTARGSATPAPNIRTPAVDVSAR